MTYMSNTSRKRGGNSRCGSLLATPRVVLPIKRVVRSLKIYSQQRKLHLVIKSHWTFSLHACHASFRGHRAESLLQCIKKFHVVIDNELSTICPKAFITVLNGWLGESKLTTDEWLNVYPNHLQQGTELPTFSTYNGKALWHHLK